VFFQLYPGEKPLVVSKRIRYRGAIAWESAMVYSECHLLYGG
jgi:hypothetical protein